jgi:hypothetical protein
MPRPASRVKRLSLQQKDQVRPFYLILPPKTMAQVSAWIKQEFGCILHETTISRIVKDERSVTDANIETKVASKRFNLQPRDSLSSISY